MRYVHQAADCADVVLGEEIAKRDERHKGKRGWGMRWKMSKVGIAVIGDYTVK
jgi:uncharacterized membrane protein